MFFIYIGYKVNVFKNKYKQFHLISWDNAKNTSANKLPKIYQSHILKSTLSTLFVYQLTTMYHPHNTFRTNDQYIGSI